MMLFTALPTYDRSRVNLFPILDLAQTLGDNVYLYEGASSFLTAAFNLAWVEALNLRETKKLTHFLLLHADVVPLGPAWINVLLDEMERVDAKVLSLILPIKDGRGLVSTALDNGDMTPRGFTTAQIQNMPETFTHPDLLVNSGCLLVDFREPWVEQICFDVNNAIVKKNEYGKFEVKSEPEDYHFSRQCKRLGVPVYATRKVKAHHVGNFKYPNDQVWGQDVDEPSPSRKS